VLRFWLKSSKHASALRYSTYIFCLSPLLCSWVIWAWTLHHEREIINSGCRQKNKGYFKGLLGLEGGGGEKENESQEVQHVLLSNNLLHHVCRITNFLLVCDISGFRGDKYGLWLLGYEYFFSRLHILNSFDSFSTPCVLDQTVFLGPTSQIATILFVLSLTRNFLSRFPWRGGTSFSRNVRTCLPNCTLLYPEYRNFYEIHSLLGYYATSCGNCLQTFRNNVSVPSSRVKSPRRKESRHRDVIPHDAA
jgi:hypothetical protein